MPRYRFTAFARKSYGEDGWSIRVEGFPGTVEESTTTSVADAARTHVAHNLRVPIDDITVHVSYLSPQAIPVQPSARSRYGTDVHITRRAFGGTTALAAVEQMRSWLTEETQDSVRLLSITVQYDPDEVDGAAPVELGVMYERFFHPVADARILADPVIALLALNGLKAHLTDASDEEEAAIAIAGYDDHLFVVAPADGERAWATLWRDEHDPEFTDVESTLDGLGLQSAHDEIAEAIMRQLAGHPPALYGRPGSVQTGPGR
ncbi:hypothetical protein ACIRG5_45665 [Lentzea sp. NPDC102401]|uniref:hypothetical protein n=1 Tax=Lentzea sp. NPDC102401 TaxID=3364128 RepID=UPI0038055142